MFSNLKDKWENKINIKVIQTKKGLNCTDEQA